MDDRASDRDIHPDLQGIARVIPRGVSARGLGRINRAQPQLDRFGALVDRLTPGGRVEVVDGRAVDGGAWSCRLHRPSQRSTGPRPALLWIHGGGYVLGNARQEDRLCRLWADGLGIVVAAVDYRLAPAHPFPAPLEDCHDALVWLAGLDDVDSDRVAIGGASAGGGLCAGLAIMARDRGVVTPVLQLLTYPMLDDRTALRDDVDEGGFRLWSNESNRFGWESYLGVPPGSEGVDQMAAAARCDDLTGLAPAWMGVGTLDLFHDEDVAYAERLRASGVPCDVDVVDGAFHGFDSVAPRTDVARDFCLSQSRALVRAFRSGSSRA